ncbi:hypothetical protein I6N91_00390 [Arthrobacter sp. MSA 4-2]|uniref:hypothetical protein n=1 Tax=Arthrobacter sp. MSA 4-2 TaxID=2794349 RepID=UPI0018E87FDE|nr:hypothetical protein [Arthrobacter sp. MSA 4-2]MBJ2119432.1 hypothetical protein [Arthrobacter sp. MSA 4-2]
MVYALEPADFSRFAAAKVMLGMAGIVASALVPLPLCHAVIAHPQGSEQRREAMAFSAMISVLVGLAAALVTGVITAGLGSLKMAAIVALSALVLFLGAAPTGWFQGELRFMRYLIKSVGEVLIRLIFSVLVVFFAWGAAGAVLGFAMGGLALLVTPRSFFRDLTWRPHVLRQKWRWVETAGIAVTLCVMSVLAGIDVVLVAFLDGGSTAAAGFQALASIGKAPVYVAAGTVIMAFPLLRRPGVEVASVLMESLRTFGRLALLAWAVITTVPHALVALILPDEYGSSFALLPWLALSGLGYATLTVLATILLALRAYRRCQLGLLTASALIPGGLFLGWEWGGVPGIAIGCAFGAVAAACISAVIALPLLPPHSGRMAVRGFVAALGFALVLVLAGQQPSIWALVVLVAGLTVLAQRKMGSTLELVRGLQMRIWQRAETPRLARQLVDPSGRAAAGSTAETVPRQGSEAAVPAGRRFMNTLGPFLYCFALALAVRAIGLLHAFELWVDEMLYAQLGQSIVSGGSFPRLPDGPFFLHPPGFFVLEAGVINLFGLTGDSVEMVMQLRWVNAVLGALTVGVAFLIVQAVGTRGAAWVTAGLLIFEPFVLRNNSRVFLETLAMAAVIVGLAIVVSILKSRRSSTRRPLLLCAGLAFGLAIVTKDFFVLCTVAPVLAGVIWRQTIKAHDAAILLVGMAAPYTVYMTMVVSEGMLPVWIQAKEGGFRRLIGLDKFTGFTAEGAPNILERLIDNAGHFGTSYLLLGLCPVAGAFLCFSLRPARRLIGLMGLSLGAYGVFSALFGTFEEQYGYGVMILAGLGAVLLGVEVVERWTRFRRPIVAAGAVFVLLTAILGLRLETSTDNGFVQAKRWVSQNLPADAKVSVTNDTGELAFSNDPRFGIWPSTALMQENGVDFILTQSLPTSQGYGYMQPAMHKWLEANATPVFQQRGLTNGATTIWRVGDEALIRGVRDRVGTPTTYGTGP